MTHGVFNHELKNLIKSMVFWRPANNKSLVFHPYSEAEKELTCNLMTEILSYEMDLKIGINIISQIYIKCQTFT
jgi:hypothetical protein